MNPQMEQKGESSTRFTDVKVLSELDTPNVPKRFVLPPSQRPDFGLNNFVALPIVDLSSLENPSRRSSAVNEIRRACQEFGLFQAINHGIAQSVIDDATKVATDFFNLPLEEKMLIFSDSINEPVRYGSSIDHARDKVTFWREFIKHYSHPIENWIHLWPANPPNYKEKMGNYARQTQVLYKQLVEIVLQSLGLPPNYLQDETGESSQVITVNYYPTSPQPELTLGMPPHADFGLLTILIQSCSGLQIIDCNNNWVSVPAVQGGLIVQLGDQFEVLSNGKYKSLVHRVILSTENKRISVASLHSLAINKKIRPAPELVDKQDPVTYNEFSLSDFLDYLSRNELAGKRFIDTLKKIP